MPERPLSPKWFRKNLQTLRWRLWIALGLITIISIGVATWEINSYNKARQHVIMNLPQEQELIHDANQLVIALIGAIVIDFILLGFATYFVRRWIMHPLHGINSVLRHIADGQIHRVIEPVQPEEFVQLTQSAEAMRRTLVEKIAASTSAQYALNTEAPIATALHAELEPRFNAKEIQNFEVAAYGKAASGVVSGDWWDIFQTLNPEHNLDLPRKSTFALVDVEGHGAETGITGLQTKSSISAQLQMGIHPEQVIKNVSSQRSGINEKIMSAFLLELPVSQQSSARWLNAGHPAAVVLHNDGSHQLLEATGVVIAGIHDGSWKTEQFEWQIGETVIIASDGLFDLRNVMDQQFDVSGLIEATKDVRTKSSKEIVNYVVAHAQKFAAFEENRRWTHEDITVVAITRNA